MNQAKIEACYVRMDELFLLALDVSVDSAEWDMYHSECCDLRDRIGMLENDTGDILDSMFFGE